MPCRAYNAEGIPAAISVESGVQSCNCSCSTDIVVCTSDAVDCCRLLLYESFIKGEDEEREEEEEAADDDNAAQYPDNTQPPKPMPILTTSSVNATDCLFVFGWMYRFDSRGIIA